MQVPTSATASMACPCTASDATRMSSSRTEGCPQRTYWQCVQSMRKKLNDLTLTLLNSTPMMHLLQHKCGYSKQVLHLSEPLMSTASRGALEAAELSFQSFTMESQPVSGLVERSMGGSLSTSCPEGQLALTGMDYSEIERRVLSWKMSCLQSGSTKADIAAWLYSGQPSPLGRLNDWQPQVQSLAGSTGIKQGGLDT
jgi:hypothetical protein